MSGKFTLITGANRGLGFEAVDILARQQSDTTVLLGVRSLDKGHAAVEELKKRGVNTGKVQPLVIDQTNPKTIADAVATIKSQYAGRIDTLYLNAGALEVDASEGEAARIIQDTNYFGVQRVIDATLPLIPKGGHIVIVSSEVGSWVHQATTGELRRRIDDYEHLTTKEVDDFVHRWVKGQNGDSSVDLTDYPSKEKSMGPYGISKVFLSTYGRILARQLREKEITVALVCPGYCSTELNGNTGPRKATTGAHSIVYGEKVPLEKTGGFFQDGNPLPIAADMPDMEEYKRQAKEHERKLGFRGQDEE